MSTDQVLQVPVLWKAATFENFVALFEKIYALFEKIYALFEKIYALFEKNDALFEKIYATFGKPEAALLRQPFWMNQYLQPTLGTRAPSPATDAGEGARVPRQSSEITVVIYKP